MRHYWTHRFKPCPFCGCKRIEMLVQQAGWLVRCWECRVGKLVITRFRVQVVAEWNMRVKGGVVYA